MKIYKISALSIPYGFKYGDELITEISSYEATIYHSTKELALQEIQNLKDEDYLRFMIEEFSVDSPSTWNVLYYDKDLNLISQSNQENMDSNFYGKEPSDCKFQLGQLVEFLSCDRLLVGIIAALPPSPRDVKDKPSFNFDQTDNCYLILHPAQSGTDKHPHDHVLETNILGPLYHKVSTKDKIMLEERFKKKS